MSLFCLVHGSTQNASGWKLLIPELQLQGHEVISIDLPSDQPTRGGVYYADIVIDSLKKLDEKQAIVVAHSASGLLLPLIAARHRVARLVFLAAAIPVIGKSFIEQLKESPEMIWPDWIGKDPTRDNALALHYLFHDCAPDTAEWALTTLNRMLYNTVMSEPCPISVWPAVPSSYIVCSEDRTARPDWCRRAARERLQTVPIELIAGHCPHVSRPKELSAILNDLSAPA
jgi:pimeloyl-ACP methyl ester carboxylesterase